MALNATIYTFNIQLADTDRGVYEALALRLAQHPSEAQDYLVTRLLAYCLEYTEGIAFSKGLSTPDEPALAVRDLTGQLITWIDVGLPDAARLHRASKAAGRVAVYTHRDPALLVRSLQGATIYRAEALELYAIERSFIAQLVQALERRMSFELSVSGGHVYVNLPLQTLEGRVQRLSVA